MKPRWSKEETVGAYLARLKAWEEQGEWIPASGGTETPFTTKGGHRLLYCWQPRSGRHAYLDLGTDLILSNEEAANVLGMH